MIVVLVRSFDRPMYLYHTLRSIESSQRKNPQPRVRFVIYDDGSTNPLTLRILKRYQRHTTFHVVLNKANLGCAHSYIGALLYLFRKHWASASYFAIVDNDIQVSPDWLGTLVRRYKEAQSTWPRERIVLSGFNPTNAHRNTQYNVQRHIHERTSVGAVCYFFARACLQDVARGWLLNKDWGVNKLFHESPSHHMCALNEGVVNHVGAIGLNSTPHAYDRDASFDERYHNKSQSPGKQARRAPAD